MENMLGLHARVARAEKLAYQIIDGRAVVVLPRDRAIHWFDEIGTDLWNYLQTPRTLQEIVEYVCEHYDVTPEIARKDMEEFVEELRTKKLVTVDGSQ